MVAKPCKVSIFKSSKIIKSDKISIVFELKRMKKTQTGIQTTLHTVNWPTKLFVLELNRPANKGSINGLIIHNVGSDSQF